MKIKGYKAFYKDENDKLFTEPQDKRFYFEVGKTYKINNDSPAMLCENGFHFCKKFLNLLCYYPFSKSVVCCEVEGISEDDNGIDMDREKICVKEITIIKQLSFDKCLEILENEIKQFKEYNKLNKKEEDSDESDDDIIDSEFIDNSHYIKESLAVTSSSCVINANCVMDSKYIHNAKNVMYSTNVYKGTCIRNSWAVIRCQSVCDSKMLVDSRGINEGYEIINSNSVEYSHEIIGSVGIFHSKKIIGSLAVDSSFFIINSRGIHNSQYIINCKALSNCFFCIGLSGNSNCLFNKQVDKEYISNVREKFNQIIDNANWQPYITNGDKLIKNSNDLSDIAIYDFRQLNASDYFNDMPEEAINYLKSLPEFNAEIFESITNIKIGA